MIPLCRAALDDRWQLEGSVDSEEEKGKREARYNYFPRAQDSLYINGIKSEFSILR